MKRFVRRFRHEISTPLSGAALHLEVASRRLQKNDGFDREAVLENLRVSQQALENASQMLDWIGDFARGDDSLPGAVDLGAVVTGAAEPFREDLRRRGLALELPASSGGPSWFGSAHELSEVVSEITANAFQHAGSPGTVRWAVDAREAAPVLTCESPGALPAGDPEHLFGAAKGAQSAGRGFGLLRARRLAQSNGADLTLAQTGASVRATLRFLPETA
ncbi:MAG TPA: ATP-binding protein [Usitatibacter sp.]|nr:ATP-binding protein [Usitatibacter sp.]